MTGAEVHKLLCLPCARASAGVSGAWNLAPPREMFRGSLREVRDLEIDLSPLFFAVLERIEGIGNKIGDRRDSEAV
jgi:hypothetical protein